MGDMVIIDLSTIYGKYSYDKESNQSTKSVVWLAESFISYVRKISRKTNISYPLISTRTTLSQIWFIYNLC